MINPSSISHLPSSKSDIVIKAENIGKVYTIGHQAERGGYTSLRDVWMQNALTLWNKTKDLATGKAIIQGDTMEEFWALKDVSFEIRRGEAVGIIGRNGAGKSTLLKVLSRITEPSTGRVTIKGRVASLLEVGTGFHPELSGRENIYLNGTILGMTRSEIKSKFDEIVSFSEVEKYLDTPVKRYSSGMYVRLAFAVAAHLEPEILVVDEVLAVGDAQFQKKCLGKMGDVAKEGRTVLFVSHNMGAINNLCTSAVLLEKGSIKSIGQTKAITDLYLEASYQHSSQKEFPINPHLKVQIVSVRLLNDKGKESCEFRCGTNVTVEYTYVINTPVSGCHAGCYITTVEGYHLFSTADTDTAPELFSTRKAATYHAHFDIPTAILNTGTYNIGFSFGIPGVEVFDRQEVLSLSITDTGAFGAMKDGGRRAGLILCEVPWHYEQIRV